MAVHLISTSMVALLLTGCSLQIRLLRLRLRVSEATPFGVTPPTTNMKL